MPERNIGGTGPVSGGVKLDIPGLETAISQLSALDTTMKDIGATLKSLNATQFQLTSGITKMLSTIGSTAAKTTTQLNQTNQAMATTTAAASGSGTARAGGWAGIRQAVGGISSSDFLRDVAMFPLRFMQSQIRENRDLALMSQGALGGQFFATGAQPGAAMRTLSGMPGSVYGTPQELIDLQSIMRQAGAMLNLRTPQGPPGTGGGPFITAGVAGGNAPRAAGFLEGMRQMQLISPGTPVSQLATTLGGYSANTQAQQTSAFLTGGAFSMIGRGGRQRSLSEWAESILRWLENERPGGKRGEGFTYDELLSQNFPGSNIDAWLQVNGIPPDMREYWWSYALGKTNRGGKSTGAAILQRGEELRPEVAGSVAYQRLISTSAQTRGGFQLAGTLTGAYANREVANTWFNDLMAQMVNDVIPSALSRGALQFMQFLPDTVEDLMMTMLERSKVGGLVVGGTLGYGPGITSFLQGALGGNIQDLLGGLFQQEGGGDIGDVGDWSPTGSRSTAGLHPDMRQKVGKMMQANRRLRINSGMRDRATQIKLRRGGNARVSGLPSAHTRGFAADMGPASEYPWLAANAHKFGLASGVGAGEPWHVGMPHDVARGMRAGDVGDLGIGDLNDIGQYIMDGLLGPLMTVFGLQDADPDATIKGISAIIPTVMKLMVGAMTARDPETGAVLPPNMANLRFLGQTPAPGLYARLSAGYKAAGEYGGEGGQTRESPYTPPATGTGPAPPATPTTPGDQTPADVLQQFASTDTLKRGAMTVDALYRAGFRGEELKKMANIAYYESGWQYWSWVNDSDDIGGGLFAINQKPYLDAGQTPPWTRSEIQDPWRSAVIAYNDFYKSRGYQPWTTRNKPMDKGPEAYARYKQDGGVGDLDEQLIMPAMPAPYYGDAEVLPSAATVPSTSGSGVITMNFNNTFNIQGGGSGGGGIDVRRTATLLADHLEDEMNRRMARRN